MTLRRWILPFFVLQLAFTPPFVRSEESADPWRTLQETDRQIPDSGDHAGNVFLEHEDVTLRIAAAQGATAWRATDDLRREVAGGMIEGGDQESIAIGRLGIGWYRITWQDAKGNAVGWTTAAVLARLAAPIPQNSPVCLDSATSWFARDDPEKQQRFARLASLAGVNWIRDRIRWRDLQPATDQFAAATTYDSAAGIQHRHGLKILQVNHSTPPWAVTGGGGSGRFPGDLRAAYRFGKAMSTRFQGQVQAWEPWNEANVADFGGHTMDEICSLQKAAYLGLKAGNPKTTVCWNVTTGVPTPLQTEGVLENETWPYFDTYQAVGRSPGAAGKAKATSPVPMDPKWRRRRCRYLDQTSWGVWRRRPTGVGFPACRQRCRKSVAFQ